MLSERAAMLETVAAALNPGDVVEGVVSRLADYGAFVSLRSPDGNMHGVEASAHALYVIGCLTGVSHITCTLTLT